MLLQVVVVVCLFLGGAVFVGGVVVVGGGGGHTMIKFCVCVNLLRGGGVGGGFTSHRNPIWHAFQQPWLL